MYGSKTPYNRDIVTIRMWCKWRKVRIFNMKFAILLKAVSSLQAQSNYLSEFNDRKYGTWKA